MRRPYALPVPATSPGRAISRHGPGRGGRARGDAELAEDVGDVAVDGVLAQHEPLGDLPVGEALGDELEHLALPRAERAGSARARPELVQARRGGGVFARRV